MFPLHRDLSSYSEPRKCACPKFSKLFLASCIPLCPGTGSSKASKLSQSSLCSRVTEEWRGGEQGEESASLSPCPG